MQAPHTGVTWENATLKQEATDKLCINSYVAIEPTAVQEFGMFTINGMEHDNKGIVGN